MEQYKVDFESIPWNTPAVGVRFKVYKRNSKQLRLVEFTSKFVEPDGCVKGHIGYIIEGTMEVNFNEKLFAYNPGDGLFIPAGEKHKHMLKVITDTVKLILVEDV